MITCCLMTCTMSRHKIDYVWFECFYEISESQCGRGNITGFKLTTSGQVIRELKTKWYLHSNTPASLDGEGRHCAAVATVVTVFNATCCNWCCNPYSIYAFSHPLWLLCRFLCCKSVKKVYVQADLYYSVTDDLWHDAIRYVTVTANHNIVMCAAAEYKSSFTSSLGMTRCVSMWEHPCSQCEYSLRHNETNVTVVVL